MTTDSYARWLDVRWADVKKAEQRIVDEAAARYAATAPLRTLRFARAALAGRPGSCDGGSVVRYAAAHLRPENWGAVLLAEQALSRAAGATFDVWQEEPGRTHAEVLAVFDKAIADVAATLPP